jgi:GNAT superfamily N-acetyltransferase
MRAAVLRPGQAPERLIYPGDEDPGSLHLAAMIDGAIVGIASVMADQHPRDPAKHDWRVRGMASAPDHRRSGIGGALLAGCERHARGQGGRRLWCHARLPARAFYEQADWTAEGEVFELPDIGPHVIMAKPLD